MQMTDPRDRSTGGIARPASNGRRVAFTVLAFVFAAGALGGLFGIGLVIGWFDTDAGGIHRVHDLGFGILFGILLTGALVALARRPERKPSVFLQIVAVAVAALVSGVVSATTGYVVIALVVVVAAAILYVLHPARGTLLRTPGEPSPMMATAAVAGAVPLVWFGLTTARLQRDGPPADPHVQAGHWATMAAMAFALVLVGLLASLRLRGWRFTAWCAGLGAAVYGLASIVFHRFPSVPIPYPGSEGVGWGLVALLGGLAFIAVSEWEARRARARS
jgi:hypothetical protein